MLEKVFLSVLITLLLDSILLTMILSLDYIFIKPRIVINESY